MNGEPPRLDGRKPLIALVGRPNVGKSTLFNRLAEKKKAIVIDEPGATRDRNYSDGSWFDRPFLLVDTGGFEPSSQETILIQMRRQTTLAMEEADIILFIMDGRQGLLPADEEIARLLHGIPKPVFYAVNKLDAPKHRDSLAEFYRLGVELFPVSAQQGLGIDELMDRVAELLPQGVPDGEEDAGIKIAVIGKPNVGKSSLVNRFLGCERAIVNPLPGTTRDPLDTPLEREGKKYLLIDTAGIRRKGRVSLTLEKYSVIQAIKAIDRAEVALLLIDGVEGMTEQDTKIAGLAVEKGKAIIIVVNKWDLVEKDNDTVGKYVKDIKDKAKFLDFAPIIFISAATGQRVVKILDLVEAVYLEYTKKVNTSELNRAILEIVEKHPPPRVASRKQKLIYATQVGIKPPTFLFFVRDPRGIHFSYERFLINQFREAFGFKRVPIRIYFRKK